MSLLNRRSGAAVSAVATLLVQSATAASADPVADPVGPSCVVYAPDGSLGSAPTAPPPPVSVALSSHPELSAISAALSGDLNPAVNLVGTLDGGQFTVFAPANNAFSRLPPEAIGSLRADAAALTRLLTYHVVPGRFSTADIGGTQQTLQGGDLSVTGPPDRLWVNDALVLCGGITTANATIYLIDTVLTPPPW